MKTFALEDRVEETLAYFGNLEYEFRIALNGHLIKRIYERYH